MKGTIYKITNLKNNKIYIGQTIQSIDKRIRSHKSHLKCGVHHNELLQRTYDKYGEDIFKFETIEECDIKNIDERERYWIFHYKTIDRKFGYNFENGGNVMKKHHKETIEKFIKNSRGKNNKLSPKEVAEIKELIINGNILTEIAKQYDVTTDCIYRIKNLENWEYISPELNDKVFNTNTSRKINHLSEKEIKECKCLISQGKTVLELSREYDIPYKRFRKYFDDDIKNKKEIFEKRKSKVLKMFFQNYNIEDILKETGLSYPQYKRITSGHTDEKRKINIKYVGEQLEKGKTNVEIAKELNVNRCTISVYKKEYLKNKLIP